MRTYLISLLATLTLLSCGGGNDVASSVSTAVSAAATSTSTPSTTAVTATPTPTNAEPKVNGQIDERTGVAPVAAQATIWTPLSNGGCGKSSTFRDGVGGPSLTWAQQNACNNAINNATSSAQCIALGGIYLRIDSYFLCLIGYASQC